jgi:NodT family efflux transporter outer membrane factor (OMF) lipoprotein
VPASWHGSSPFVEARPSDAEIRTDWWKLFREPVLDRLEMQAMAANPDLQAAAERFVQARDIMMKAQSRLFPRLGLGFGGSDNKQSENALFRAPDSPIHDVSVSDVGIASWEPDFWYAIRNETRAQTYRAEFALARLSLQAEIASNYFTLRGYDAQVATYKQSIDYYRKSLTIVNEQFEGKIASELDVARAKALLTGTEAELLQIQGEREVVEHALAILVNTAPASFKVGSAGVFKITPLRNPQKIPSTLLERRPDIAAAEREMAQANREIGIARAAFFPKVEFRLDGGFEDHAMNLLKLTNSFWSYGSMISLPVFEGGLRRAQLQQSWSVYREREDKYRSTVLNAFREVENGLSLTRRLSAAAKKLNETVAANLQTQNLTMDLYRGGLGASLELIYAQVATLTARIDAIKVKTRLITSSPKRSSQGARLARTIAPCQTVRMCKQATQIRQAQSTAAAAALLGSTSRRRLPSTHSNGADVSAHWISCSAMSLSHSMTQIASIGALVSFSSVIRSMDISPISSPSTRWMINTSS